MTRAQQGFTLVELLVVIAILGILAALAIPQLLGSREKAWHATCLGALHAVDGDVVNRMSFYESNGDPAAADKAIDDVITIVAVQQRTPNPRNKAEIGYEKVNTVGYVPTVDATCVVYLYDASTTVSPVAPVVVLTQFEGRVRSYRIALS